MDGRILQSAWPSESRDWLLKAALLPEAEAREAWRAWSSTVLLFNDLPRGELRLQWDRTELVTPVRAR